MDKIFVKGFLVFNLVFDSTCFLYILWESCLRVILYMFMVRRLLLFVFRDFRVGERKDKEFWFWG